MSAPANGSATVSLAAKAVLERQAQQKGDRDREDDEIIDLNVRRSDERGGGKCDGLRLGILMVVRRQAGRAAPALLPAVAR
jgi:hypothetical protein